MKPTTKYILVGSAVIVGTLGIVWGIRSYQKYQINKIDKSKEDEELEEHIQVIEAQEGNANDTAKSYNPVNDIKYIRKYLKNWNDWVGFGTDREEVADKLMSLSDDRLKKLNLWYNSKKNPKFTWRINNRTLYQELKEQRSSFDWLTNYKDIMSRMAKLNLY
ncbi:MAG: hypothetical protein NTY55_11195 [Flavobacteriia bacterium]|nr:hypothetical protein [Flavobacteriia bacterium]